MLEVIDKIEVKTAQLLEALKNFPNQYFRLLTKDTFSRLSSQEWTMQTRHLSSDSDKVFWTSVPALMAKVFVSRMIGLRVQSLAQNWKQNSRFTNKCVSVRAGGVGATNNWEVVGSIQAAKCFFLPKSLLEGQWLWLSW